MLDLGGARQIAAAVGFDLGLYRGNVVLDPRRIAHGDVCNDEYRHLVSLLPCKSQMRSNCCPGTRARSTAVDPRHTTTRPIYTSGRNPER